MTLAKQIANHFREVYFGSNWTSVNLKDTLADVNWRQAITKVPNLNTIAALVYHLNYYVNPVLKVLQGDSLNASDKLSFAVRPISSEEDWQKLVAKVLTEAELFAVQIETVGEKKMFEDFEDSKYGNYLRNLLGIIEHTYYHLGQISLIKKMIDETKPVN